MSYILELENVTKNIKILLWIRLISVFQEE